MEAIIDVLVVLGISPSLWLLLTFAFEAFYRRNIFLFNVEKF